jgi:hypothetical protein
MRDAPREVRDALDGAMAASELHLVLQRLLGTLHGLRPPPLIALAATLWLVHALTAAVSGGWGGADAAHWALQGALQSMGLVLGGGGGGGGGGSSRAAKAQSEAVLEASLELVHAAARLRAAPAASARTVGTILDACGPERLGALLAPSASVPEDMRLSPPRREQLMRVASALLSSQWKALLADEVRLSSVMGLLAAGLSQPSDLPAARQALQAIVQLHERWASGGAVGVVKAALAVVTAWNGSADMENRNAALAIFTGQAAMGSQMHDTYDRAKALASLKATATQLKAATGRIDPKWSEVSRVARGGKSWPTDGGPDTLRAMYAAGDLATQKFRSGRAGDTYVAIADWAPDGSYTLDTIHQYGSGTLDASSPHYADQAPIFAEKKWKRPPMKLDDLLKQATRDYRVSK